MPISDELEALRRGGLVKHKSTRLSAEVSKHGFVLTDPEHIAERRKQNSLNDKQSRLDAQKAWNSGGRGAAALNDLNLLYKKLITEQKAKRREAEKNLREWKKQQYVGKGDGTIGAVDGVEFALPPPMPEEDEEVSMNNEALEMLPEHVVAALKEKYETDDAAAALAQALKEESDHDDGKGTLAQLMELPSSPVNLPWEGNDETIDELPPVAEEKAPELPPVAEEKKEPEAEEPPVEEEEPADEEKKEPVVEEETEPVVEEKIEPVVEEKEEEKVEDKKEPDEEEKVVEPVVEEKEKEKAEEETVEEIVQEKVEEEKVEEKEEVAEVQEELEQLPIKEESAPAPTRKEKDPSTINPISQTKRFYNTHAQEFIDNISPHQDLTPTTHRSTFLTHLHTQQQTSDSSTVIDLGCGFGRDALHFTSLGNHVLGIDFSHGMLHHAKKLAPKAHFLTMDIRALGNVLVEQSVDGVWAHASLLHLPKNEILDVLKGLYAATKVGGVLYLSLRIGSFDQTGVENREVFDVDERYIATESDEDDNEDDCDSRRKLYSYYTKEEVQELLADSGWEVLEMGEDDRRGVSEYVTHSMMFVFATRRTI